MAVYTGSMQNTSIGDNIRYMTTGQAGFFAREFVPGMWHAGKAFVQNTAIALKKNISLKDSLKLAKGTINPVDVQYLCDRATSYLVKDLRTLTVASIVAGIGINLADHISPDVALAANNQGICHVIQTADVDTTGYTNQGFQVHYINSDYLAHAPGVLSMPTGNTISWTQSPVFQILGYTQTNVVPDATDLAVVNLNGQMFTLSQRVDAILNLSGTEMDALTKDAFIRTGNYIAITPNCTPEVAAKLLSGAENIQPFPGEHPIDMPLAQIATQTPQGDVILPEETGIERTATANTMTSEKDWIWPVATVGLMGGTIGVIALYNKFFKK
jgi:hypothetical protein